MINCLAIEYAPQNGFLETRFNFIADSKLRALVENRIFLNQTISIRQLDCYAVCDH